MSNLYNCLLVDPFSESVVRIQLPKENFIDHCKDVMGITSPVDIVTLHPKHMVIVDDEGLFNEVTQRYFKLHEIPQPLAGRAVIVSFDEETGDTVSIDKEAYDYHSSTINFKPDGYVQSPYMEYVPIS
mgnify:FL=1|tara:strand:- start:9245 stop:9628 length:384 start_codon:yes stop_codon:yes gene_type:complete